MKIEAITLLLAAIFNLPDHDIQKRKSKSRTKKLMDEKVCQSANEIIEKLKQKEAA